MVDSLAFPSGLSDNSEELDAVTLQLPYQLGQETETVYAKASEQRRREAEDSHPHQRHKCTNTDGRNRLYASLCCPMESHLERLFT